MLADELRQALARQALVPKVSTMIEVGSATPMA